MPIKTEWKSYKWHLFNIFSLLAGMWKILYNLESILVPTLASEKNLFVKLLIFPLLSYTPGSGSTGPNECGSDRIRIYISDYKCFIVYTFIPALLLKKITVALDQSVPGSCRDTSSCRNSTANYHLRFRTSTSQEIPYKIRW